jgi:predicted Rossmann fold flavoprotein
MVYDVIVIGGGPAGLMACGVLNKKGINYLLLEKNEFVGKKLLITGGTRCNVTNNLSVDDFISSLTMKHKRFLYGALNEYGPKDVLEFFKDNGLNLVLENNLKYFPETNKSSSVLEVLKRNVDMRKVKVNNHVKSIKKNDDTFIITTNKDTYQAKKVVIATGSSSYPMTGSSGDGLILAKQLGIDYKLFTPAETHVYSKYVTENLSDLQGVSLVNTKVRILGTKIENTGGLVFTHFGVSGPTILHSAEFIYEELQTRKVSISFNITESSTEEINELLEEGKKDNRVILRVLEKLTTKRLSRKILELAKVENKNIKEISKKDMNKIIELLTNFTLPIDRVQSKEKAFVNAGGIITKELNPKTMESKKVPGLYFIGETVDVHGPIGGFNVTIALSMGYKCGNSI